MSEVNQGLADDDIVSIMSTQQGRKFVAYVLQLSGVDEDIFHHDTHMHAHNAGARSVGLNLKNLVIEIAPDKYITMMKEQLDE